MNKKLSGVFTVILMINVLTFNIYAMEHLIDRNDREYSEILSLNDEILDSLNHGWSIQKQGKIFLKMSSKWNRHLKCMLI